MSVGRDWACLVQSEVAEFPIVSKPRTGSETPALYFVTTLIHVGARAQEDKIVSPDEIRF